MTLQGEVSLQALIAQREPEAPVDVEEEEQLSVAAAENGEEDSFPSSVNPLKSQSCFSFLRKRSQNRSTPQSSVSE